MNKKLTSQSLKTSDYLLFIIIFFFPTVTLFFNKALGVIELVVALAYTAYRIFAKAKRTEQLYKHLQSMTLYLDQASRESLTRFPMPVTLLDKKGDIIWYNDLFNDLLTDRKMTDVFGKNFDVIVPNVSIDEADVSQYHEVDFLGRHYSIFVMHQNDRDKEDFYSVYWVDTTKTTNELLRLRGSQICVAHILIDSFDELPSTVTELQTSTFLTRVDVKVRAFAKAIDGVLLKTEQDKYFIIFERKYLQTLENNKFKILSEVRDVSVEGLHATLSIGIGLSDCSALNADADARRALDISLSRGGNQAAIIKNGKFIFYGGNSDGTEKRKRVKVRIIAEALTAQVQHSDHVIIMGHKYADLDCVGASLGIAKCVQAFGKTAKIVYNAKENLAKSLYEKTISMPEFEGVFVDEATVIRSVTENTLLIVVDTHNIEYVESERLLEACKRRVVIDHHRKIVENAINDTVINFHEPNASSCCEMVSEICENVPHFKLSRHEANALLSGIYLDTKTFTERTSVRTFEAAAYLKRQGADTAKVKEFFKNDIESYKKQIDMIAAAEVINKTHAVSVWNEETFDGIKLIASKAADELLNLSDIECSYVIYPKNQDVHISARSDAHGNVQRYMELLGGGGHRNAAGAQIKDSSIEEVYQRLIEIIESEEK